MSYKLRFCTDLVVPPCRERRSCRCLSLAVLLSLFTLSVVTSMASANLVTNPGFETIESIGGAIPTSFGDWDTDIATIVTTESGIIPRSGDRMLRFDFSSPFGPGASTGSCEIIQLIDVSAFAAEIAAGQAVAAVSFFANRVAGDIQTDTLFRMRIRAHSGDPANFPSVLNTPIDDATINVETDDDPNTWEIVSAELALPVNTDYLSVWTMAEENVFNDASAPEFDGHYADDVSLTIMVCGDEAHPYPVGDLNFDCVVNLEDLVIFALHWLEDNRPG